MRRTALFCVPALVALLLVGCGGTEVVTIDDPGPECPSSMNSAEHQACISEETADMGDAVSAEDPEAIEEEVAAAAAGPLSYVGTITYSDNAGTTFTERVKVGRLHKSSELTPPQAPLAACDDDYSTGIASSVFARGEATITYEEGTLPYEFDVFASGLGSIIPFKVDGAWECTGTGGIATFEPGETQTFPFWIVASGMLSNAEPNINWAEVDTWAISGVNAGVGVGNGVGVKQMRGPGAVACQEPEEQGIKGNLLYRLLLYGRPSIESPLLVDGAGLPCRKV